MEVLSKLNSEEILQIISQRQLDQLKKSFNFWSGSGGKTDSGCQLRLSEINSFIFSYLDEKGFFHCRVYEMDETTSNSGNKQINAKRALKSREATPEETLILVLVANHVDPSEPASQVLTDEIVTKLENLKFNNTHNEFLTKQIADLRYHYD